MFSRAGIEGEDLRRVSSIWTWGRDFSPVLSLPLCVCPLLPVPTVFGSL